LSSLKQPITDLFPHSLQLEAQQVLGEEFSRLPKRIQTGYTTPFWHHGTIDGQYVLLRKEQEGATSYPPTTWINKIISAFQGGVRVEFGKSLLY